MQNMASDAPMKVARAIMAGPFRSEFGEQAVWQWRGGVYQWDGCAWVYRSVDWLKKAVWHALEDASWNKQVGPTLQVVQYAPTKKKVDDVMAALETLTLLEANDLPVWLDGEEGNPEAGMVVPFRNGMLDVTATARIYREQGTYEWQMLGVSPKLFTRGALTVDFDEGAECPVWEGKMREWSGNDEQWMELRERVFGYACVGARKYPKWVLEYGKARGGKGSGTLVLGSLLPRPAYFGIQMRALNSEFGMDGLDTASTVVVSEVNDEGEKAQEAIGSTLKLMLGGDECTINAKYQRQRKHVVLKVLPIVQGNNMLRLPNKGMGISSKMLALPFDYSWYGKEDWDLPGKLKRELKGIAVRLMKALVRLEAEEVSEKKFEMGERSKALLKQFEHEANPFDWFLESYFQRNQAGFVHGDYIRKFRVEWEGKVGQTLKTDSGDRVSDQNLMRELEKHASWLVRRDRQSTSSGGGPRGMTGLSIKKGVAV